VVLESGCGEGSSVGSEGLAQFAEGRVHSLQRRTWNTGTKGRWEEGNNVDLGSRRRNQGNHFSKGGKVNPKVVLGRVLSVKKITRPAPAAKQGRQVALSGIPEMSTERTLFEANGENFVVMGSAPATKKD